MAELEVDLFVQYFSNENAMIIGTKSVSTNGVLIKRSGVRLFCYLDRARHFGNPLLVSNVAEFPLYYSVGRIVPRPVSITAQIITEVVS